MMTAGLKNTDQTIGMIPPGHDAWVVGDKPVVGIDIQVNSNQK
jgi:hypothetical protein